MPDRTLKLHRTGMLWDREDDDSDSISREYFSTEASDLTRPPAALF